MSRIVFMGSPEFATPCLKALISSDHEIPLVVTQPDRPKGRGNKLQATAVKALAIEHGLEVFQPERLKGSPQDQERITNLDFDYLVVVAFGQILPKAILEAPKKAPLNVHASLLPAYRGAAPIARAIMEGEEQTGVSIQWMVEELDMGDILYQTPCSIQESDTSLELYQRLSELGAQALLNSIEELESGSFRRQEQDPRIGSYAEKLHKSEAPIDFGRRAEEVHRKIMGLNPWPVAECQFAGQRLRVFRSAFVARNPMAEPGTVVDVTDDEIVVACSDACVSFLELQLENRKRMSTRDFLRGTPLPEGLVLGGAKGT